MNKALEKALKNGPRLQTKASDMLSSGSVLLNLACTGSAKGAFVKGDYVFLVGDSMSGKTWLSMTCFAEAVRKKSFDQYAFIFDDVESGCKVDIEHYFGKKTKARLQAPPLGTSETVQDFYANIVTALDKGPCIYILDSMDALGSDEDVEAIHRHAKAKAKNKTDDSAGSYGTQKSRANSKNLKTIIRKLSKTGSILIIISQTRENIGFGAQFNPKTRSGGKALRFYANVEIWTSIKKTLTKTIRGKKRSIGVLTECAIKKNRWSGQTNKVEIPLFNSYGIDDIQSCISFLCEEGDWTESKGNISAPDFEYKGKLSRLVAKIETEDLHDVLADVVEETWKEIIEESRLKRKAKYSDE
jgi:RecA/RadA recombinase